MVTVVECLVTAGLGFFLYQWYAHHKIRSKLSHIPTVGSSTFIWSYFSALRFLADGNKIFEEGRAKYGGSIYKFPSTQTKSGWMILVGEDALVEDLRKAPPSVLSFPATLKDTLATELLLGPRHSGFTDYHAGVTRAAMTRALPNRLPDVRDEIAHASNEFLPKGLDWEPRKAHEAIIHIVTRSTNRLFVGLPLCRNEEYCKIHENWTIKFVIGGHILHLFPKMLRPLVAFFVCKSLSSRVKIEELLRDDIEKRLGNEANHGSEWEGKPNDAISWLIDAAPEGYRTVEDVATRITMLNFAAIHITSAVLTTVLFDLVARQEYIQPLREEVETVISEHGWTKESMGLLVKMDSFIKESSRLALSIQMSVTKQVMKDYTLPNGVLLPEGSTVAAAVSQIHMHPAIYEDPLTFNGFRFVDGQDGNSVNPSSQMASADSRYLLWGLGRNVCPGRFFAVNEIKLTLAHILLNYDIKLPGNATEVPPGIWFAGAKSPNPTAQILFKKREQVFGNN